MGVQSNKKKDKTTINKFKLAKSENENTMNKLVCSSSGWDKTKESWKCEDWRETRWHQLRNFESSHLLFQKTRSRWQLINVFWNFPGLLFSKFSSTFFCGKLEKLMNYRVLMTLVLERNELFKFFLCSYGMMVTIVFEFFICSVSICHWFSYFQDYSTFRLPFSLVSFFNLTWADEIASDFTFF